MKKLPYLLLLALIVIASSYASSDSLSAEDKAQLTFGIYPYDTPTSIYESFGPLLKKLSSELNISVKIIIAPNYMSHVVNMGAGKVDIGFMGPSPYIRAEDKYGGVELLARLRMQENKIDSMVIVSHKDSGIRSLKDLKGKTFAFGDPQSYGSHFYPRYLLNKSGVRLNDLKYYDYLGSHSKVILAVSHRDFDAGGVRADIYEKYKDRPVKVIAGPYNIPPHVIVCRKGLPDDLKNKIKDALLKIDDKAVLKAIDQYLKGFGPVKDGDFSQARTVVDYIEGR
jgi:phosphonate transport system substrate-binding protein